MEDEETRIVQLGNKLATRYQYLDSVQNGNHATNSVLGESIRLRRRSRVLVSQAVEMRAAAKESREMAEDSIRTSVLRIKSCELGLM
jgi:hypothetical protein